MMRRAGSLAPRALQGLSRGGAFGRPLLVRGFPERSFVSQKGNGNDNKGNKPRKPGKADKAKVEKAEKPAAVAEETTASVNELAGEALSKEELAKQEEDGGIEKEARAPNIVDIITEEDEAVEDESSEEAAEGETSSAGAIVSKKEASDGRPRFVKLPNVFAMGLSGRPLMPGQVAFMHIEDSQMEQYLLALCKADIPYIGIFRSKKDVEELPDLAAGSGSGGSLKDLLDEGEEADERAGRKARDRQQRQRRMATQKMVKEVLGGSGVEDYMSQLFLALPNPTSNTIVRSAEEIYEHGVYASIQRISKGEGGLQLIIKGESRIRMTGVMATKPALVVKVEHIGEEPQPLSVLAAERVRSGSSSGSSSAGEGEGETKEVEGDEAFRKEQERQDRIKAYTMEITSLFKQLSTKNHMYKHIWSLLTMDQNFVTNPSKLADYVTTYTHASGDDLQEILETQDIEERLKKTLSLLKKQQSLLDVQMEIRQEVESKIEESQRRHLLGQQLSYIKKELGIEKDDKQVLIDSFRARLKERHPEEKVLATINEEIDRLSSLDQNSSEFSTIRNYLDWLTILPWGVYTKENYSIRRARRILAEDHYGMDDVKNTVLQFIAMGKLRGGEVPQGKILCLVGPPGVGKTSIGKSIARALNRKFYRFSVGGMNDVTEIKGHRRTYVGAMPGKFVQCLKRTQSSNALILIDEIDKMGTHRMGGDPSAALLEALDPEQNGTFMDHYLDVPVDLSKVMFLCTSNSMEIPEALRDRMEFVELSGYDLVEKLQIAKEYLIPKEQKKSGLRDGEVDLTEPALRELIQGYCRESGVRSLDKHIQKIYRKVALEKVELLEEGLEEEEDDLELVDIEGSAPPARKQDEKKAAKQSSAAASTASSTAASEEASELSESAEEAAPAEPLSAEEEVAAVVDAVRRRYEAPLRAAREAQAALEAEAKAFEPQATDAEAVEAAEAREAKEAEESDPDAVKEDDSPETVVEKVALENARELSAQAAEAEKLAAAEQEPAPLLVQITPENLEKYVGVPIFESDRYFETTPPGVVMGLAWTKMGGSTIYIETIAEHVNGPQAARVSTPLDSEKEGEEKKGSQGSLQLTGSMGDVMKESAWISYSVAKRILNSVSPGNRFFAEHKIHLHVPEGAISKDGPSAGVTMTSALLSLALKREVLPNLSMTGEITLTGQVLKVGGVKEKLLAARRSGSKVVVLPATCRKDVLELKDHLKEGLEIHFAHSYEDVMHIAFPDLGVATEADSKL